VSRKILGVDPSFNRTGWAVLSNLGQLEQCGVIAPKGADRSQQLLSIWSQFSEVLDQNAPQIVYIERPGTWQRKGGTRRETLEVLSMSRGAMLLACASRAIPLTDVEVHVARLAMCGRVNASSEDIVRIVQQSGIHVPRRPRGSLDLDIANAVLMALYGRAEAAK